MSSAADVVGGRTARFSRAQLDPLLSPRLQSELPGLATALDEVAMRPLLQATLFGAAARHEIERCNPDGAIYLEDGCCVLRYELKIRDAASGENAEPLVIARIFPDHAVCAGFLRDTLEPAAARLHGRPELATFRTPIALLEPLRMAVHVFPIDPELSAVSDVTDRRRMIELFGERVPDMRAGDFTIRDCRIEVAHYGRSPRCTLRYTLEGTAADGAPRWRVVYGKVAADGSSQRTISVIAALREQLGPRGDARRINVPGVIDFWPDLQLLLLEAIPGRPFIRRLLKARLVGTETPQPMSSLEEAITACGRIAAALHSTNIGLGSRHTLDDELESSQRSIPALRRVSPDLGAQLETWLGQIAACARQTRPLKLRFSHGDFKESNLISDGATSGLVDFDTVCQAEPALDVGQFLAYLRLAILKYQRTDAPLAAAEIERLCARLFDAYVDAVGCAAAEAERLRARVQVYETLLLLRLAVHSWQKFKVGRLAHAVTLLEERIACLASGQSHAGNSAV